MSDRDNASRIGIVTHNVDTGGAQRVAIREAHHLQERGSDVTLFSMIKPRDPWTSLLEGLDVQYVFDVGNGAFGEALSRFGSGFARLPAGYDLLLCHNLPGAQLGHRARERHGTPYAVYVHDATAYPITGSPFGLLFGKYSPDIDTDDLGYLGRLGLSLERRWLTGAGTVVANATRTARDIEARHGLSVDVLYPTLLGETDDGSTPPGEYFLVVQRLDPHPTYDLLEQLLERVDEMRVVIAGSSAAEYLESKIRGRFERFGDRVTFRVDPSDEELARLYAEALAYLQPGVENFNMSALEAASANRPIVVSAESGITELFEDYPLFVPAEDVEGFERVVRWLLDDRRAAEQLGRRAGAVADRYGDRYHVEKLQTVLGRCREVESER